MFWWLRELLSSLRFLVIQSGESILKSKRVYEFILPGLVVAIFSLTYFVAPKLFAVGFVRSIAQQTFQFMVFVVPFHLAALGAFATFQRPVLDEPLKGTNAEVRLWSNRDQEYEWVSLTLRQYTSLLFGYLCSIGLAFICLYITFSIINFEYFSQEMKIILRSAAAVLLVFFVAHYVFLSVYAITFLFDKVNGVNRA